MVIRKQVAKLAKDLKLNYQIQNQLECKLLKMEHRTYLWLYLAIEGIHETYRTSLRPEKASITSLPSSVEDAYENFLSRVPKQQENNVRKILLIIVGARRPLTLQEMAIALGIATSTQPKSLDRVRLDSTHLENNIRYWCGLFIFINHDRIYLIHQTAKEFLVCNGGSTVPLSGWKHCLDPLRIEKEMTQICVEFLRLDDVQPSAQSLVSKIKSKSEHARVRGIRDYSRIDDVLDKNNSVESFLAYSAEYWPHHLRDADVSKGQVSLG